MSDDIPGKRLGKGMLYAFWLAILAAGTLFFNQWIEQRNNPNQQPNATSNNGVNEVVLHRNRQHHYVATGFINGAEVTLLLDTGATQVSVPAHIARKLRLTPGAPSQVITANGRVEVRSTVLQQLQLGSITWTDVPAHINPGMRDDQILLGMSALKNVEFTHRDGTLTLRQYY